MKIDRTFAVLSLAANVVLAVVLAVLLIRYDVPTKIYDYLVNDRRPLPADYSSTSIRRDLFMHYRAHPGAIVMVGDSLVAAVEWNELLGRHDILNRGIGGEMTADILGRIDEIIGLEPRQVFLLVGINDIAAQRPAADIAADYERIVAHLSRAGTKTVILSIIKTRDRHMNAVVDDVNRRIRLLDQRDNVSHLDLNERLTVNGFLSHRYTYDGVHLSGAGYDAIRDLVLARISPAP